MKIDVLVDSNALYSLFTVSDPDHQKIIALFQQSEINFIVPQVVLTEAAFLFNRYGGMRVVAGFLRYLKGTGFALEPVTYTDLERAAEILEKYQGTKLELVDCCIVALAERLNIKYVVTLDRRDFIILRTKSGNAGKDRLAAPTRISGTDDIAQIMCRFEL